MYRNQEIPINKSSFICALIIALKRIEINNAMLKTMRRQNDIYGAHLAPQYTSDRFFCYLHEIYSVFVFNFIIKTI